MGSAIGLTPEDVLKPKGVTKSRMDAEKKKTAVRVASALVRHYEAQLNPLFTEVFNLNVMAKKADDVSDVLLQVATHFRMEMGVGNAGLRKNGAALAPPRAYLSLDVYPALEPSRNTVCCYCLLRVARRYASPDGLGRLILPENERGWPANMKPPTKGIHTYIGYTTNLINRLRQHNGVVSGGAKATKGCDEASAWVLAAYVAGFPRGDLRYSEAQSFEWAWKHARVGEAAKSTRNALRAAEMAHPGLGARAQALDVVLRRARWTNSTTVEASAVPLTLHWVWPPDACPIQTETLPPHVALVAHKPSPAKPAS